MRASRARGAWRWHVCRESAAGRSNCCDPAGHAAATDESGCGSRAPAEARPSHADRQDRRRACGGAARACRGPSIACRSCRGVAHAVRGAARFRQSTRERCRRARARRDRSPRAACAIGLARDRGAIGAKRAADRPGARQDPARDAGESAVRFACGGAGRFALRADGCDRIDGRDRGGEAPPRSRAGRALGGTA